MDLVYQKLYSISYGSIYFILGITSIPYGAIFSISDLYRFILLLNNRWYIFCHSTVGAMFRNTFFLRTHRRLDEDMGIHVFRIQKHW